MEASCLHAGWALNTVKGVASDWKKEEEGELTSGKIEEFLFMVSAIERATVCLGIEERFDKLSDAFRELTKGKFADVGRIVENQVDELIQVSYKLLRKTLP